MSVDEIIHHQRGMGKWERYGHPLDTLTVLVSFIFISVAPFSEKNLSLYLLLSSFSCLFVTKDEFIHKELCTGLEQWLHSILFILHPLVFLSAGLMWKEGGFEFFTALPYIVGAFLIYQILVWSVPWKK